MLAAPRVFFYEAALILETGTEKDFRAVWVTSCARETQLARLMARNGIARAAAEAIVAAQMPVEEKAARADLVIRTDGTLADVERAVTAALATLAPS
jgi:dephospho-CoA kinase